MLTLDEIQIELEKGDMLPGRAADFDWKNIFIFSPEGYLVWKYTCLQNKRVGKKAGWLDWKGYSRVKVNGRSFAVHRIIWEMHYGPIPQGKEIDHIDRKKGNNKLNNLRLVTPTQNCQNKSFRKDNKSGATGVHWHTTKNKWAAYVSVDKKLKHLGYFKSFKEAKKVRDLAVIKYNYLV